MAETADNWNSTLTLSLLLWCLRSLSSDFGVFQFSDLGLFPSDPFDKDSVYFLRKLCLVCIPTRVISTRQPREEISGYSTHIISRGSGDSIFYFVLHCLALWPFGPFKYMMLPSHNIASQYDFVFKHTIPTRSAGKFQSISSHKADRFQVHIYIFLDNLTPRPAADLWRL
jgi:hypothetical protein